MDSYGVVRYRAVATSAVREAANRDTFLDRVRLKTGLEVEIIDGSEENRLTYLAVREALRGRDALESGDTLLVEVGGGSADLSFLRAGQPVYSGTYPLGLHPHAPGLPLGSRHPRDPGAPPPPAHPQRRRGHPPGAAAAEMPATASCSAETCDSRPTRCWGRTRRRGPLRVLGREEFLAFCDQRVAPRHRRARRALPPDASRGRDPGGGPPRLPRDRRRDPGDEESRCSTPPCVRGCSSISRVATRRDVSRTSPPRFSRRPRPSARSTATTSPTRGTSRPCAVQLFDELASEHGLGSTGAAPAPGGGAAARRRDLREPASAPQALPLHPLGVGDLRSDARRHAGHRQRRALPSPDRAPAVPSALRHARLRAARARLQARRAPAPRQRPRCRSPAEGLRGAGRTASDERWALEVEGAGDLTLERLASLSRADLFTEVFGHRVSFREAQRP